MFRWSINEEVELKLLDHTDAKALFALVDRNRAVLREWLPWLDYNQTVNYSQSFIRSCLETYAANKGFAAGIWYRGQLAGVVSYHPINWANRKVALGYWVGAEFQGRGLAKKATRVLVDYAFTKLDLNRVELFCATGNLKSQRVARALGFREEGIHRQAEWLYDHFVDHIAFSLLKEEWTVLSDKRQI